MYTALCLWLCSFASAQESGRLPDKVIQVNVTKTETTAELMARAAITPDKPRPERPEFEVERDDLPLNPLAPAISSYPPAANRTGTAHRSTAVNPAQKVSTSFLAVTGPLETAGSFPPDVMGAVGPTQFVTFLNGRIRTFNKTTGAADGVLNLNPDVFFASVMTPIGGSVTQNFTTDPRVRYDRLAGRWVLVIIDAPMDNTGNTVVANRVLIAVSNSATISAGTSWSFSQFTPGSGFADYETLGIDANAVYIGTNMFTVSGTSYTGTQGSVIKKADLYAGGAYSVASFTFVSGAAGSGPYTPQGVDNFDPSATEGYFVGVDNAVYGKLQVIRISNPGSGSPTASSNIGVTVPSTVSPTNVPHLGNTNGSGGYLDGLDDRLYAAVIRNGQLWTAHTIRVSTAGVASTTTSARNAVRWYNLNNLTTAPTLVQSGTIFDASASNPRFLHIPTMMVSGQGHVAVGMSTGGLNDYVNVATAGRWSSTTTGTMLDTILITQSSTAYNPSGDPGGSGSSRRWGDYSYVSLDPLDDMTMWVTNQYCSATNSYGVNVTKMLAPPPATPTSCSPASAAKGQSSVNIVVTGSVIAGSGFYDPGTNLPAPAQPFNHISATVTGGVVVNSVTYTSPTQITINVNTNGASLGAQTVTVTNPDGQVVASATGILTITAALPVALSSFDAVKENTVAILKWTTAQEQNNKGFEIQRSASAAFTDSTKATIGFVSGVGNSQVPTSYRFTDNAPLAGRNYYRLKQVDLDGKVQYSEIKALDFGIFAKATVYPNPFNNVLTVANVPDKTAFKIFNEQGQLVMDGKLDNNKINTSRLVKGAYTLQLIQNDEKTLYQLIKE